MNMIRRKNWHDKRLMAWSKSSEVQELSNYLSKRLNILLDERNLYGKDLARVVHHAMDIAEGTASGSISKIRCAEFMMFGWNEQNVKKYLDRTAIIFHALGVVADDELVGKVQEFYPNFTYPPDVVLPDFEVSPERHPSYLKVYGGSSRRLAKRLGNLRYDSLSRVIGDLAEDLNEQAVADKRKDRPQLAGRLEETVKHLQQAQLSLEEAWRICKPYMGTEKTKK